MHSQERWDIAVVGAGPAGASLAIEAARMGLRVILLDAATFPRQKVCGEYISAAGWRRLTQLGLQDLFDSAVLLSNMRLTADDRLGIESDFDDVRSAPRAISRYLLDARLVDEAQRAGATVLTGRRVRRVIVNEGRAVALACSADGARQAAEEIEAKLIVAADGRRSTVVRDTGRIKTQDSGLWGFKRHVPADPSFNPRQITMHALPGGYLGTCATEDGTVNVCGVMPRRLIQAARGDVATALQNWFSHRPDLRSLCASAGDESWHTMPDISCQSSHPHATGVLYVGDAMGTIEPLTGQGMTMALHGAQLACRLIQSVGVDGVDRRAQQQYRSMWQTAFAAPIASATWYARLLHRPKLLKAIIKASRPLPGLGTRIFRAAYRRTLTG